jgi:tetratricopeptide (TPR) repeat protein
MGEVWPSRWMETFLRLQEELVALLRELVLRESPTTEKAAVDRLGEFVAERLRELGAQVERDTARAIREYQRLMRVAAMRERVIADLEQAVQLRPDESRLWQALGDAYQEAGKLQKALEAYRRALAHLGS